MSHIDATIRACSTLYRFRTPFMKNPVDFESCFHASSGDENTHAFLVSLTAARESVRATLGNSEANASEMSAAIDGYLPLLWQLFDSLERQSPIKMDVALYFAWEGAVTTSHKPSAFGHVLFELIMTLHAKGISLSNAACDAVMADFISVNAAAKNLREASAVMSFLSTGVIPRWQAITSTGQKPPECSADHVKFMADYFEASANQMVVVKALQGCTTPSLMTSLCLKVVRSMEYSLDILHRIAVDDIPRTDPRLAVHIATQREYFHAMVYAFEAEDQMMKTETGIAIALCSVAQSKLQERTSKIFDPMAPGLPRAKNQSAELRAGVAALSEKVATLLTKSERENGMIYFKAIPRDVSDLPDLPAPASLTLPAVLYEQPTTELISFSFDHSRQKSLYTSITSLFL